MWHENHKIPNFRHSRFKQWNQFIIPSTNWLALANTPTGSNKKPTKNKAIKYDFIRCCSAKYPKIFPNGNNNKCLWHGTRLNNCSFWLLNFVTMRVFFQWFICIFGIFMHFSPWADTEPGISLRSSHNAVEFTSSVSIVVFAVFSFFKYSHFRGIMEKKPLLHARVTICTKRLLLKPARTVHLTPLILSALAYISSNLIVFPSIRFGVYVRATCFSDSFIDVIEKWPHTWDFKFRNILKWFSYRTKIVTKV